MSLDVAVDHAKRGRYKLSRRHCGTLLSFVPFIIKILLVNYLLHR
jgi:hypothetical protein